MINSFRMRKRFARIFLPFLTIWLCVFPAQKSEAVVPLVALGISAITTTGITVTAADVAGLAIATAGMGAILYMKMTAPDGHAVAIPAQDSLLHPAAVIPAPAAAATVAPIIGNYWSSSPPSAVANLDDVGSSPGANCSAYWNSACVGNFSTGSCVDLTYGVVSTSVTTSECRAVSPTYPSYVANGVIFYTSHADSGSCPNGYSISGADCVLTNARAVVNDLQQDWQRAGAIYSPITGDQIGNLQGVQGVTISGSDSLAFIAATNPATCPDCSTSSVIFNALANGGTVLTSRTQRRDSSQATYVQEQKLNIAPDGTISSSSTANLPGSLDASQTAANGGATLVGAPAGSIPANPAVSNSVSFPSDYSRAGEAAAAAAPITNALTNTSTVTDPSIPVAADMPVFGSTFDSLLGWQLPAHSSACPQPSMDLSGVLGAGNVFTMTAHCTLFQDHAGAFNVAMTVVWSLLALFMVLAA